MPDAAGRRCCQSWPPECTTPDQTRGPRPEQNGVVGDRLQLDGGDPARREVRGYRRPWRPRRAGPPTARRSAGAPPPRGSGDQAVDLPDVRVRFRAACVDPATVHGHPAAPRDRGHLQGGGDGGGAHGRHRHARPSRRRCRPGLADAEGDRDGDEGGRHGSGGDQPDRLHDGVACARQRSAAAAAGPAAVPDWPRARARRASGTLSSIAGIPESSATDRVQLGQSTRCASKARRSSSVSAPMT